MKVIWIDIGTHLAQEYNAIFSSNFHFSLKLFRRALSYFLLRRGWWFAFSELKEFLSRRRFVRRNRDNFIFFFVEANPKIIESLNFPDRNHHLINIAMCDAASNAGVIKLFFSGGDSVSQGNTIYTNKRGTSESEYVLTYGVPAPDFFLSVKHYLSSTVSGPYRVFLRVNCEGVEDAVIYAAHSEFGEDLQLVGGSLKDVAELKGADEACSLDKFLSKNKIPFVKFSSSMKTWNDACTALSSLIQANN